MEDVEPEKVEHEPVERAAESALVVAGAPSTPSARDGQRDPSTTTKRKRPTVDDIIGALHDRDRDRTAANAEASKMAKREAASKKAADHKKAVATLLKEAGLADDEPDSGDDIEHEDDAAGAAHVPKPPRRAAPTHVSKQPTTFPPKPKAKAKRKTRKVANADTPSTDYSKLVRFAEPKYELPGCKTLIPWAYWFSRP